MNWRIVHAIKAEVQLEYGKEIATLDT